ncbi:MAG: FlgD immunoglobulin-like domain containing protein [Fidelibacterota bacterium]
MKNTLRIIFIIGCGTSLMFTQSIPYAEDFEDGDVSEWELYRSGEEALQVVDMSSAPATLPNGGSNVGYLQDIDASYSGAAIALVGSTTDQNYTIDGDVYVYHSHPQGSAYTGLVVYADTSVSGSASHGYYVKLVADFDGDNRFRLYNNQLNMSTFQYTFSHSIDASVVDTSEGWHHMAVKVQTLDDGTTEYTCYYDGQNLGSYIDDGADRVAGGQYGVYAFQMDGVDGIAGYYDNIAVTPNRNVVFSEDFEDGDVSEWELYRSGEEALQVVDMSSAPATLPNGGSNVGYLQDIDASYSGAAIALVGSTTDQNYTIDGDVYVYHSHPQGSAYTGLVVYADTSVSGSASHGYYVKLVADFDGDNRFRLYNNQLNMSTFQYTFSHSIDASVVDTSEGWHHMAVKVQTLDDGTTEYTCYYDGQNLGSYIDDGADRVAGGQYGVYAFQMDGVDGIAGYYDNIVVSSDPALAIDSHDNFDLPQSFSLNQNFPNPFNPTTTISFDLTQRSNVSLDIFNMNGQFIRNLISGNYSPNHYSVTWDGKNNQGRVVPTGVYLYTITNGMQRVSKKMIFLK